MKGPHPSPLPFPYSAMWFGHECQTTWQNMEMDTEQFRNVQDYGRCNRYVSGTKKRNACHCYLVQFHGRTLLDRVYVWKSNSPRVASPVPTTYIKPSRIRAGEGGVGRGPEPPGLHTGSTERSVGLHAGQSPPSSAVAVWGPAIWFHIHLHRDSARASKCCEALPPLWFHFPSLSSRGPTTCTGPGCSLYESEMSSRGPFSGQATPTHKASYVGTREFT